MVVLAALGLSLLITSEAKSYEPTEASPKTHVYMVVFDQMPVVTYNGKILGLRGTAKYFSERWRKTHKRYHFLRCGSLLSVWKNHFESNALGCDSVFVSSIDFVL